MKITDEEKQCLQTYAAAMADTTAVLAAAGTLCVYAAGGILDNGVLLLVSSACAGEMVDRYTNLSRDQLRGDMYDVEYLEPVEAALPQPPVEFGVVIQDYTKCLLHLNAALHNLHHAYVCTHATEEALERERGNPRGAEYQDAKLFHALHRQTLWRQLALCNRLHHELLLSASRINILWHRYELPLPQVSTLSEHDVAEIFTNVWRDRAHDIARYHLSAFHVHGFTAALQIVKQKAPLTAPTILLDEQWHRQLQLLSLSFQQALDRFYA